ncbi:MAG: hypothetical protein SGPRY_013364, partial [Prymnesium sp.]
PKVGAFHDWNEDVETAEIFLPLPEGTKKKELVCSIHADKLIILHKPLGKTLLRAEPLAGLVVPAESTWYLQDEVLMIVLAKQWRGQHNSDQYWGGSLAAKGGAYECYLTVAEVAAMRRKREYKEAQLEAERRERPKRSTEKSKLTPGMSWHLWIVLLACVVMVPLIIHKIIDRRAAMRGSHADDASWYDRTVEVE